MAEDNLETRVSALEDQVARVSARVRASEQDAAAARVLAGAADRDVAEIRTEIREFREATTAGFNAFRQEFVDHCHHTDQRFDQIDRGFAEIRAKLDAATAGQQHIAELLQSLITKEG